MSATIEHSLVAGFEAVTLQNGIVRAVVLPSLGGRVWELEDCRRGRQWIWHRPGVPLAATTPGDAYDDVWAGGWEELFPNDAPGPFDGRALPDHGEWWALPWTVVERTDGERARLVLRTTCAILRARCTKTFELEAGGRSLTVHYTIQSDEPGAVHFLFKQHLPVALTARCTLDLPGGKVWPVDPAFGSRLSSPGPFDWPIAAAPKGPVDLRTVPPAPCGEREFVYVSDVPDGWCGVTDHAAGASLRMTFDRQAMPYVWLFLSYGGWRDVHTAVLEPCTNMPKDLSEAVARGQSAHMAAHGSFETSVTVTLGDAEGR